MSDQEMAAELAELRSQLLQLQQLSTTNKALQDDAPSPVPQGKVGESNASPTREDAAVSEHSLPDSLRTWLEDENIDAELVIQRLKAGAGEWLADLNNDLKDTKPSTILLVFGLGALVGRLGK